MYSNFYIFRYAVIMVVLVAAILSSAAMLLKPYQERNIAIDKMKGILASASIEATAKNAIDIYKSSITQEIVLDKKGEIISIYNNTTEDFEKGNVRAFDLDLKKELYNKSKNTDFNIPLFVAEKEGSITYIIPLYGKGLWGPIWGNIALQNDLNTIVGVTFGHKGETPGLGAEIDTKNFQKQFMGKQIFSDGEFQSVQAVKGGVVTLPENMKVHGVDAISGGTITSNGVNDMLKNCLENYVPYIHKHN